MLEPFQYEFFVKGLIATTLVGALCGLIGVYIVLRRMAYVGHGLSHAIFGGAVVSYVMSINFFIGATVWGFVASILIILTTRKRQIETDSAIGIVTTASFALGVAIISRYNTFTRDFEAALIGNMLGVSMGDLVAIAIVTAAAVVFFFAGYKLLLVHDLRPGGCPFLQRAHGMGRRLLFAGLSRDHSGVHAGGGRDVNRRRHRHPARHRPAADPFL